MVYHVSMIRKQQLMGVLEEWVVHLAPCNMSWVKIVVYLSFVFSCVHHISVIIRHNCISVVDLCNYIYLSREWIVIDCALINLCFVIHFYSVKSLMYLLFVYICNVPYICLFYDVPILCTNLDVPYICFYCWCTLLLPFFPMYWIFALFSDTPNMWWYLLMYLIFVFYLWYTQILLYIPWCT